MAISSDKVSLRLIFALGAGASLYQGVDRILHPHAMVDPLVNIVVLAWIMLYAALFCMSGELTRADIPSGEIGARQLVMQRVRG
jgi:hypothetical protein